MKTTTIKSFGYDTIVTILDGTHCRLSALGKDGWVLHIAQLREEHVEQLTAQGLIRDGFFITE